MNINVNFRTRLSEHKLYIASLVMIMASLYSDKDLNLIPELTFAFVENYIKENKFSSRKKSINKGFKYFSEGYIKDLKGFYEHAVFNPY